MIKSIKLKNIDRLVFVPNFNLIVGGNNSGKSYILNQICEDPFFILGNGITSNEDYEYLMRSITKYMIDEFNKSMNTNIKMEKLNLHSPINKAFKIWVTICTRISISSTILIDDLGIDLDHHNAYMFVELLNKKIKGTEVQLIATTHNEYVMDKIDIENWNILYKENNKIKVYNYTNSGEIIDEFLYTGLRNFNLFSSNFLKYKTDERNSKAVRKNI